MKKEYKILILITILGGFLRFYNLTLNPFFVDEAWFGHFLRSTEIPHQEFINYLLGLLLKIFHLDSDWYLRSISAISGTLSIPLIYYVLKKNKLLAATFIAFCPLTIFWSQYFRPYALSGFLIILGWRWWWFYIPALLNSSISIFGIKVYPQKKIILIILIFFAGLTYFLRPDSHGVNWTHAFFYYSRIKYIPYILIILYLCDYIIPFFVERWKQAHTVLIITSWLIMIYFLIGIGQIIRNVILYPDGTLPWYKNEIKFGAWKDIDYKKNPRIDYSTDKWVTNWYSGYLPGDFRNNNIKIINAQLLMGDTLNIALDYYFRWIMCDTLVFTHFPRQFFERYGAKLFRGKIIQTKLWLQNKYIRYKVYEKN